MNPPPSLWWSTLDEPVTARDSLHKDTDVDVAIVGGGFTGLWTARELKRRDPSLSIAVVEKSVCGYGASGRNGGWASALFPLSDDVLVRHFGMDSLSHLRNVLHGAVRGLGEATHEDQIDAHFVQGGSITFARSEIQESRLRSSVRAAHALGLSNDDLKWIDPGELNDFARVDGALGATFSPHCGRINPARLVRGLSDVVERLGVHIFENTAAVRIIAGSETKRPQLVSPGGTIRANFVIRATEGFTPTMAHQRRTVAPIFSLMIATAPQSKEFWERAGFSGYETFADDRHLIIYGQRTNDDRIAFGGRGSPYHFGSTIEERFDQDRSVFRSLLIALRELFPNLEGEATHQWGGPLAMPRDLMPSVQVDRSTGLASAGGYTGDGVVLSRVCATALADLITDPDHESDFTVLPFVHHRSKKWEVEPLRWLGINFGLGLATWADHVEKSRGVQSRASQWLDRLFDQFPP